MASPAWFGIFVTVIFAHNLVGALASRHLSAANPAQVPLCHFLLLHDQIAEASTRTTSP